jgi:hypothetical protein
MDGNKAGRMSRCSTAAAQANEKLCLLGSGQKQRDMEILHAKKMLMFVLSLSLSLYTHTFRSEGERP